MVVVLAVYRLLSVQVPGVHGIQHSGVFDAHTMGNPNNQLFPENEAQNSNRINILVSAQPLVETLIGDALCFGRGPRFYQENIDKAAVAFLSGAAAAEGLLIFPPLSDIKT